MPAAAGVFGRPCPAASSSSSDAVVHAESDESAGEADTSVHGTASGEVPAVAVEMPEPVRLHAVAPDVLDAGAPCLLAVAKAVVTFLDGRCRPAGEPRATLETNRWGGGVAERGIT